MPLAQPAAASAAQSSIARAVRTAGTWGIERSDNGAASVRGGSEARAGNFRTRAADAGGSVLFLPAASGVQFERGQRGRRQAQGLALFASKSAKTPIEKAFALIAGPALLVLVGLKDFVVGRPPIRR